VGVEPAAVEIVTAPSKSNPEGFRRKRVALLTAAARVRHRLWRRPAAGGARSLTFLYLTGSRVIRRLRADSAGKTCYAPRHRIRSESPDE
jgi:hypothetical protein